MKEFLLERKGMLLVISAPSGGGKSTILRAIREKDPNLAYSISATTRKKRGDEQEGIDYYFKGVEEFEDFIRQDAFIEHARVHGNYYGTLKQQVDRQLDDGEDVLLDIDVQGCIKLRQKRKDCVMIFILPPSIATLEKRLRSRGLDDEAAMQLRLENAREEMRYARHYDYVLINDDLDETIKGVQEIIAAERRNSLRNSVLDPFGEIEFLPPLESEEATTAAAASE